MKIDALPTGVCEVQLSYHPKLKLKDLPKISSSQDAEKYFRQVWSDKINYLEESYLLLLNRANKVLGYLKLSSGGCTGTVIDSKVVFQAALQGNTQGIIIAHSHPSGNTSPSEADKQITRKLVEAGKLLEIPVLDHIILTQEEF